MSTPPLGQRIRGLAIFGLVIGMIRYALEFTAPDSAMWFGVYYLMPVAILVVGALGSWGVIRWPAMVGSMFVLCVIVWGIPNAIAYTTGQFLEWNHGRFYYGGEEDPNNRAAPIAESALGKIGLGLLQGGLTSVAGTIWCSIWGTLFVWIPGRYRNRAESPDVEAPGSGSAS